MQREFGLSLSKATPSTAAEKAAKAAKAEKKSERERNQSEAKEARMARKLSATSDDEFSKSGNESQIGGGFLML